jgi:hypothetical protein
MVLALSLFYSCKDQKGEQSPELIPKKTDSKETIHDTIQPEKTSAFNDAIVKKNDESNANMIQFAQLIQVDTLNLFCFELRIKDSATEWLSIAKLPKNPVYRDEFQEHQLFRFTDKNIHTKFHFNNLEKIFVFNKEQTPVETLDFAFIAQLDQTIDSRFVAVYQSKINYERHLASSSNFDSRKYTKSQEFVIDSTFKGNFLHRIDSLNYMGKCFRMINNEDTFKFFSTLRFRDDGIRGLNLLWNNELVDSLESQHDVGVSDLVPLPIGSDSLYYYLTTFYLFETDMMWDAIIELDLQKRSFEVFNWIDAK